MAAFPFVDVNVGIVNEYIVNSRGVAGGFGQSVINFFDPTLGLPVAPSDGDRYISLATANGWIINDLEIYDARTGLWNNVDPISGTIAWIDGIAPPQVQIWDPTTVAWQPLAGVIGAVLAPSPTTDNALVRFDGVAGQIQNSGVVLDDLNNLTGINDATVNGKLTVVGLIDPTGLELTPVAANPGLVPANTVWADSGNGDRFTIGANPVVLGPAAAPANTLASLAAPNTLQTTPVMLDSSGNMSALNTLVLTQIAAPAAPAAGSSQIYAAIDGSIRLVTSASSTIIAPNTFLISSSGAFSVPSGTRLLTVTLWGGGGGGGGNDGNAGGGAGGSGAQIVKYPITVGQSEISSLTIVIGSAGTSGGYNPGGVGGNTSVSYGTRTITAYGGGGGGRGVIDGGNERGGGGGGGGGTTSAGGTGGDAGPGVNGAAGAAGTSDGASSITNFGIWGGAGGAGGAGNTAAGIAGANGNFTNAYAVGGAGGGGGTGSGFTNGRGGSMIIGFPSGAANVFVATGGGGAFGSSVSSSDPPNGNSGAGGASASGVFGGPGGAGGCVVEVS